MWCWCWLAAIVAVGCGGGGDAAGRPTATRDAVGDGRRRPRPSRRQAQAAAVSARARRPAAARRAPSRRRCTSRRRPATRSRVMVVEQDGRIRVVRDGEVLDAAVPRHPRPRDAAAASRACSRSPSRPTTRSPGGSTSTTRTARSDQRVVEYRAPRRRPGRRRLGPARPADGRRRGPTTTAASSRSAPTACSTSARATAAAAATSTGAAATRRTSARCSARSCASTRAPPAGDAVPRAAATTRSSAAAARAARSTPTACATRGASPSTARTGALAIGDVGQDAWEEIDYVRRGRGKGANFGWRPFEGRARYAPGERAPGHVRAGDRAVARAPATARSRAASWVRDRGVLAARPLRVRRLLQGPDLLGEARGRQGARRASRHALRVDEPLLVRRGRPRPRLRRLARRARSTASPRSRRGRGRRARPRAEPVALHARRHEHVDRRAATPRGWSIPGPAIPAHVEAVAAAVAGARRRGRDRAHPRPSRPRRGADGAARRARRAAGGRDALAGRDGAARRRRRVRAAHGAARARPRRATTSCSSPATARSPATPCSALGSVFIAPDGGSLGAYLDGLRRLRALGLARLYPGHGPGGRGSGGEARRVRRAPARARAAHPRRVEAGARDRRGAARGRLGRDPAGAASCPRPGRCTRTWTSCARRAGSLSGRRYGEPLAGERHRGRERRDAVALGARRARCGPCRRPRGRARARAPGS